jgi:hypothetical protein
MTERVLQISASRLTFFEKFAKFMGLIASIWRTSVVLQQPTAPHKGARKEGP